MERDDEDLGDGAMKHTGYCDSVRSRYQPPSLPSQQHSGRSLPRSEAAQQRCVRWPTSKLGAPLRRSGMNGVYGPGRKRLILWRTSGPVSS